ncbi:MAG: TetR/AcrR family transcriptional regulator [Anaerolineae bacterium]|jgi:AcrR family transcriptional regulator|nr:TetR/AcrR family transcriptional regulator [Anaerolineae bacterium]
MDDEPFLVPDFRPPRADALKNRAALLKTAAHLFDQHGPDAITMSEIAQAAGVGKGTLYRHFNNKTDLCHALLDQDQRALQDSTLRRLRQQNPPLDDLRWFLEQVAAFVARNLPLLDIVDSGAPPPLANHAHIWWRQTIYGLLTRADVPGDRAYLADVFYALLSPQIIRFQLQRPDYTLTHIVLGLHHLLERLTPA